jgi:ABC-type nitrate/sulfonate/bicarbonate transport system substrate-binding protein
MTMSVASGHRRTGRSFERKLGLLAGAVMVASFIAGSAVAQPELKDVTVYSDLDFQGPVQLITAQKKGFFEKFGLNVTPKYYQSGSDIPPGMIGGSIVLGHGGFANPMVVEDQGFPVKIVGQVADWARSTGIVVKKELANASPSDLKTLIGPDIPVLRMFWLNWTKANGIDPASVKWLNAAPSDALTGFIGGNADALLMWAPQIIKATEAGGVMWADGRMSHRPGHEGPQSVYYNWGVIFASADWANKYPKTLEAYLSGIYMAQEYMKCHKDEVAQLVGDVSHIDLALGKQIMGMNDYQVGMDASFVKEAQGAADFYHDAGMLKKSYDVSKIIDASIIDKVMKEVEIPADWSSCM